MKALLAIVLIGFSFAATALEAAPRVCTEDADGNCVIQVTVVPDANLDAIKDNIEVVEIDLVDRVQNVTPLINERFTYLDNGDVLVTNRGTHEQLRMYYAGRIVEVFLKDPAFHYPN